MMFIGTFQLAIFLIISLFSQLQPAFALPAALTSKRGSELADIPLLSGALGSSSSAGINNVLSASGSNDAAESDSSPLSLLDVVPGLSGIAASGSEHSSSSSSIPGNGIQSLPPSSSGSSKDGFDTSNPLGALSLLGRKISLNLKSSTARTTDENADKEVEREGVNTETDYYAPLTLGGVKGRAERFAARMRMAAASGPASDSKRRFA